MLVMKEFVKFITNLPGWHTKRKIVIIESDDWGSIRMPSADVYEKMKKLGIDVDTGDNRLYNQYDTLETSDDLERLFEVLQSVKDKLDEPAKLTAVSVVANPDFKKIRVNHFEKYYFEPVTATFKKNRGSSHSFNLWKQGIESGVFRVEFHAREHLNVSEWMRALKTNDKSARIAFENGFWGYNNAKPGGVSFQAAFDFVDPSDLIVQAETIKSGLDLFESLMGYRATYFVPTNGPFNHQLESVAAEGGIKLMYGSRLQAMPVGNGRTKWAYHYFGQRNRHNQRFIMRNAMFEPFKGGQDWVDSCLKDIAFAFRCRQPAIVCSHRINYMGGLDVSNRDRGLEQLNLLLKAIVKNWPDVEFMTTNQLIDLIEKD